MTDGHRRPGRAPLAIGALALLAVVLLSLGVARTVDPLRGGRPAGQETAAEPTADARIVYTGTGSQTTEAFYLAGGTYQTHWAAWGYAPEFPPCTHSAELKAIDPANSTTSGGHVIDLARLVDVPATGASNDAYVVNLKPGDYYLDVTSACAWQIALSPN
jgi:hypothetical protein